MEEFLICYKIILSKMSARFFSAISEEISPENHARVPEKNFFRLFRLSFKEQFLDFIQRLLKIF